MSIPGHSIVPLTADDIPTTTSFLQDSKLQLAINRFLIKDWPNEAVQRPLYQAAIEGGLKNPNTTSLKVVNDKSGETVGYFFFTKRGQPAPDEDKASKSKIENAGQNVPPGLVPEVFHAVMKAVETLESDVQGEHLDVTHIYVKPSSRGQGIGTQLIQAARDEAKSAGLPFIISAEPNHHDFFLNRGFRDEKHVDIDLSAWAAHNSGYGVFRISRMRMIE